MDAELTVAWVDLEDAPNGERGLVFIDDERGKLIAIGRIVRTWAWEEEGMAEVEGDHLGRSVTHWAPLNIAAPEKS